MFISIFHFFEKIIQAFLIFLVKAYRYTLSPYIGRHCRFEPSCSCYAIEALQRHRLLKALFLITKRLVHCRPFGKSGYDPVP